VEPRIRRVVSERLGVDPEALGPDVSLVDDLAADSLDLLDVVLGVEEELGVTVLESAMEDVRTYPGLVETAQRLVRARRAAQAHAEAKRAPALVWVQISPGPGGPGPQLHCAGWLTPYTAETLVDTVRRAGPGARVEVGVAPNLGPSTIAAIERRLTSSIGPGVVVEVHRDHRLPASGYRASR
jgi:acyl carrier protein